MTLHAIHSSRLGRRDHVYPRGLSSIEITDAQRIALEEVCIDVFTTMVNAGATFQAALAAVYMTGAEHAKSLTQEPPR